MSNMNHFTAPRIMGAYLRMARDAKYRPAAPSDGFGHIQLTDEELRDPNRLAREAETYGERFVAEEDTANFHVGVSSGTTVAALIFLIEAARELCGGADEVAIKLAQMAVEEIKNPTRYPEDWKDSRPILNRLVCETVKRYDAP